MRGKSEEAQRKKLGRSECAIVVFGEINCAHLAPPFPIFLDARERFETAERDLLSYQFDRTDITIVSRLALAKSCIRIFRDSTGGRFIILT